MIHVDSQIKYSIAYCYVSLRMPGDLDWNCTGMRQGDVFCQSLLYSHVMRSCNYCSLLIPLYFLWGSPPMEFSNNHFIYKKDFFTCRLCESHVYRG